MKERQDVSVGILAGGKSSRMGTNKAFLSWKTSSFLEELLLLTEGFSQRMISVGNKNEYRHLENRNVTLVEDERTGYGPLEGLYQLLHHSKQEWILIMATDMPLLNQTCINEMLNVERKNVQAVMIREDGREHPLFGLYHVSVLKKLELLLEKEEHRMRKLLEEITVRYVTLETLGLKKQILENVNTPEEYEKLRGLK